MRISFINVLGAIVAFMTAAVSWIADNQIEEDEKEYRYISYGVIAIYSLYVFANIFWEDGFTFSILRWIQEHRAIVLAYTLIVAIIPHKIAQKEQKKGTFRAKSDYAKKI